MFDLFQEIYVSMSRNKLRIALTGFSIAWGIFMLIVLLGAGNGLLHGMMDLFGGSAHNTVTIYPGQTSLSWKGLPRHRGLFLDLTDVEMLRREFPSNVEDLQPMISTSVRLSHGLEYVNTSACGVYPEYMRTGDYQVVEGRLINEMDIRQQRKVCMITARTSEQLFGDEESHLGEWIKLYDIPFRIVGIYKSGSLNRDDDLWAPITTIGTIYKPNGRFSQVKLMVKNLETKAANEDFNRALRYALARKQQFDPDDRRAMWFWNSYEDYIQTQSIFSGLRLFIWLIGLATLIAGVMGISNIMLITVRERTREFGIRKALGARPRQIVGLVICESIAITLVFGYLGMLFGIGLTQLIDTMLQMGKSEEGMNIFQHPTVDLDIVLLATLVMVIAGVIAGYVPARRAVSIKPVEALAAS